jgi:hypothetical protein
MCPLFGEPCPILIHTDGQEIRQNQMQALANFLAITADQRKTLTDPLFEDYRATRDEYGEGPEIHEPEQVWRFVTWNTLLVPIQGPTEDRFVFVIGDPAWEREHGVELLFRNERLLSVGRAQGAFLGRYWEWAGQ